MPVYVDDNAVLLLLYNRLLGIDNLAVRTLEDASDPSKPVEASISIEGTESRHRQSTEDAHCVIYRVEILVEARPPAWGAMNLAALDRCAGAIRSRLDRWGSAMGAGGSVRTRDVQTAKVPTEGKPDHRAALVTCELIAVATTGSGPSIDSDE